MYSYRFVLFIAVYVVLLFALALASVPPDLSRPTATRSSPAHEFDNAEVGRACVR
jgi:hypothetical protein